MTTKTAEKAPDIETGKIFLDAAESGLRWKVQKELLPELRQIARKISAAGDDVDKIIALFASGGPFDDFKRSEAGFPFIGVTVDDILLDIDRVTDIRAKIAVAAGGAS